VKTGQIDETQKRSFDMAEAIHKNDPSNQD